MGYGKPSKTSMSDNYGTAENSPESRANVVTGASRGQTIDGAQFIAKNAPGKLNENRGIASGNRFHSNVDSNSPKSNKNKGQA